MIVSFSQNLQVTSQGQPIGAIVAIDQSTAQKATRMVQIEYEDLHPIIVTIEVKQSSHKRSIESTSSPEYESVSILLMKNLKRKQDAIRKKSFISDDPTRIVKGDVAKAFREVEHILVGEVRMGGQEHFYLETHCCIAVPHEEDELEIFSSTQHPSEIQTLAAHVLNVPMNKITIRVKRMGGGFGGKESRGMLIALPAALAAYRFLFLR